MKKLLLLSAFVIAFGFGARAQTEEGTWMIGTNVANIDYLFDSETFNLNLLPQAGYFVSDNIAVGAQANLGIISGGGETITTYGIGPFVRGYFGGTEKAKFFAQGNVAYSGVSDGVSSNQFDAGVALGHAWFLNKHVAFETALAYSYVKQEDVDGQSGLGLRLGFQIHLPGKKAR